ncbi:MAG: hypothetical protein WBG19_01505 [Thermoplasmata archaeon]
MATGPHSPEPAGADALRVPCPRCGGRLGPPVSRDVHCFVDCTACGASYELDDPRLAP